MKTFLPQNQFISNSTALAPAAVGSVGASQVLQPQAPAAPFAAPPSNEGRHQEASAPRCTEPHDGALEDIDCINEIFFFARKLIKQAPRYLLDEGAFMADIEEEPLFIRDGDHLRRWEA